MAELVCGLNDADDAPAMGRADMAHLDLVMIDPFRRGTVDSGRAAGYSPGCGFVLTQAPMRPLVQLLNDWIGLGQALVGTLGTLAFVCAFLWRVVAVHPRSAMQAQHWLGRIAVGTLGVELAGVFTHVLLGLVPAGVR